MRRLKPTVQDIRIGALYRVALKRNMPTADVRALLHSRAGLSEKAAEQLAAHWQGSFKAQRRHQGGI